MEQPQTAATATATAATDEARIGVAWRELRRGASMLRLRELLYGDALDLGQVDALDLMVQHGTCRMSELADALRVDASTATRAVGRLVHAGLVERTPEPVDARAVRVGLTASGVAVHREMVERRRLLFERVLAGFDPVERAQLARLLERLVSGVDNAVREAATTR